MSCPAYYIRLNSKSFGLVFFFEVIFGCVAALCRVFVAVLGLLLAVVSLVGQELSSCSTRA